MSVNLVASNYFCLSLIKSTLYTPLFVFYSHVTHTIGLTDRLSVQLNIL